MVIIFEDKYGYNLTVKNEENEVTNAKKIITTPFADDFNILTGNKIHHQKIQDDIQDKATSMGLIFKPKKCRTYSVCSGKPASVIFTLSEGPRKIQLKTLIDEPHKFLGQIITHKNSSQDHFNYMKDILQTKLENLDKSCVRNEYKLATYERYLIISLRYHFSIHTIHQTQLDKLDMLANKYLKKWSEIPARGCTNLAVFHPHLMGIKSPSQLYLEGHAGNLLMCQLKADSNVQLAIESQLSRESVWTRKSSTIVQCQDILNIVEEDNIFPSRQNSHNFESSLSHQLPKLKKAVKDVINKQFKEKYDKQADSLVFQGEFASLLSEESIDATWKSYIYGVPRGVMSFAMRSSTNVLATADNLKRWKKSRSDICQMCLPGTNIPSKCTLLHLLNNCTAFLNTKYVWRHDSVIYFILETIKLEKPDGLEIYGDVEGNRCNGVTIPFSVVIPHNRSQI